MTFEPVEKIADAVLFEGYMLYPYRPSALKNRQRWNFGTLFPRDFAAAQRPPERSSFMTEMLLQAGPPARPVAKPVARPAAKLDVRIRFLQLAPGDPGDPQSWDRGFVRSKTFPALELDELCTGIERILDFTALSAEERQRAPSSFVERPCIGKLELRARKLDSDLYRIRATFENIAPVAEPATTSRRAAQAVAFTSAHLLAQITGGAFVSLLEPPQKLRAAVAACTQEGVFPVLAGEEGDRGTMICSPIILYDYPRIALESDGDFFDATEMDEMLALRVMTLTDEEKREMRESDPHARAILERTETLPHEQLLKVHGAVRGMKPSADSGQEPTYGSIEPWDPFREQPPVESVRVFGVELRKGDRVRLWPQKQADIMDAAMEGRTASIEAIEQDLEGHFQFAVVLDDDPGRDLGMLRQPGHRFFFSPEEVEPLNLEAR